MKLKYVMILKFMLPWQPFFKCVCKKNRRKEPTHRFGPINNKDSLLSISQTIGNN